VDGPQTFNLTIRVGSTPTRSTNITLTNYQNRIEVIELDFDGKFLNFKVVQHGPFYQLYLTSKIKAIELHGKVKIDNPKDLYIGVRNVCNSERLFNVLRNNALTLPLTQV
jgi:hypothetical protein